MNILEQLEAQGYQAEEVKTAFETLLLGVDFEEKIKTIQKKCVVSVERAEELLMLADKHQEELGQYYRTPSDKKGGSVASKLVSAGLILIAIIKILNGRGHILDYIFVLAGIGLFIYAIFFEDKK
ncbi:hypothetical protein [Emticicia sp. 17c]|uniref:hypothetical protein n=1 Tax=Emticicia sp. 17c TaxID=3127704 RepID=UPI00301D4D7A